MAPRLYLLRPVHPMPEVLSLYQPAMVDYQEGERVNDLAITLGMNLRRARGRKNLSAEQVAESIGLPVEKYERMERGHLPPSTDVFLSLCTALNVPADELLTPQRGPRLRLIRGGL